MAGMSEITAQESQGRAQPGRHRKLEVGLALAAIYLIWGSTYLAIRLAIDTLPPFLMAGTRFLVAGGLLFLFSRVRSRTGGTPRQWLTAALSGGLMLAGGNGAVVWAEQFAPTGLVAVLVATVPIWIVLFDWASGRGGVPGLGVVVGVLWGFMGVVVLISGSELGGGAVQDWLGGMVVLGGAACWALGSLVARYGARPRSLGQGAAMQMLAGGCVLLILAILNGDPGSWDPGRVSLTSIVAFWYLVVFGSWVGFSSYVWLLRNTSPALASTYAYVNPVVALILGWGLAGEPMAPRTFLASFIILSSVVLITTQRVSRGPG